MSIHTRINEKRKQNHFTLSPLKETKVFKPEHKARESLYPQEQYYKFSKNGLLQKYFSKIRKSTSICCGTDRQHLY